MTLSATPDPPWITPADAMDDVPVAVLTFNREGVVTVNRRWIDLTGLTSAASSGGGWLGAVHRDDWMAARRFVHAAPRADTVGEWRVWRADRRTPAWVQATSGTIRTRQDGGFVVALTEIDAHKANEAGLLHRALHDPLTGLLNQSAFMDRIEDVLERATTQRWLCAVLYLDLDHFKDINDMFGHRCGDRLLAAASRRIRSSLRPSDTVGRLGGDEIGVLCPGLENEKEAIRLAERIVSTISQPFTIDDRVLHGSVSVGLAFSNEVGSSADELVERADRAMYRAKVAGRAQWATSAEVAASADVEPSDVNALRVRIVQAREQLHDLLSRLDLQNPTWDRLAEASHSLTRATYLLEGDTRIG